MGLFLLKLFVPGKFGIAIGYVQIFVKCMDNLTQTEQGFVDFACLIHAPSFEPTFGDFLASSEINQQKFASFCLLG